MSRSKITPSTLRHSVASIVIGLTGRKHAGKDTVANYLCSGHEFARIAIADPLKCAITDIFGIDARDLRSDAKDKVNADWGVTPRELMQFIGTEMFRTQFGARFPQIGPNVWARALGMQMRAYLQHRESVIVTDVRFPNEARQMRDTASQHGARAFIVRIERVCDEGAHMPDHDHASERLTQTIAADYVIENNGSLDDLRESTERMYEQVRVCCYS
jgi:hypothetical protein